MNEDDVFKIMQVLEVIETRLQENPNGSEVDYYIKLREELEQKLERFLQPKTCGTCEKFCGNEWCVTKSEKEKK